MDHHSIADHLKAMQIQAAKSLLCIKRIQSRLLIFRLNDACTNLGGGSGGGALHQLGLHRHFGGGILSLKNAHQ